MRRSVRFVLGVVAGGAVLAGYLSTIGADTVLARATAVAPWIVGVVIALVVLEGLADSIGVWASIAPLGDGISAADSVKFALAGDFFDILSPAGPVSSEPIMARFISVETDTGYSEALGVRSVAKYVKSGAQLAVSATCGLVAFVGSPDASALLATLGLSLLGLVAFGGIVLRTRTHLSRGIVAVCARPVAWISGLYRDRPHDRSTVASAVGRYWGRIVEFRGVPTLLVLIAVGGIVEQLLTAAALWVALSGVDATVAFLPILVVVPLPQVASVVPIPGSLGAYDLLLGGALVLATGVTAVAATAAVLVVRTVALPFGAVTGGICAAYLRGWRPSG